MTESFIVGLDGRERSLGAIRFAAWIRRVDAEPFRIGLIGVHAYVETDLQALADKLRLERSIGDRRKEIDAWLAEADLQEEFARVHVELGPSAKDVLTRQCHHYEPFALVVGRKAKVIGPKLPPRLGAVARRLVRHAPAPLIVVPPDYDPHRHGTGDVVVLTDLQAESLPPLRFASALARRCGRRVRPLHVVPKGYVRHRTRKSDELDRELLDQTAVQVDHWTAMHGAPAVPARVSVGMVVPCTLEAIEALDPLAVVVGTRELSLGDRLLLDSHSSELAAKAPCPVAVVPPDA